MSNTEPRIYNADPVERRYYFESLMDDVELSYVHGASSGVRVTEKTAMRTAAVFSCIRVIAESIAGIDLHVHRRLPGGGHEVFPGWLDTLLSVAPNPSQTRVEFLEQIIRHFEIWHRCYAAVVQGDGGRVVALSPLHPSRVKPQRLPNGRLSFLYTDAKTGNVKTYSQDEMFWMHGFSDDGETGEPLLELGKETIGLCRAMELHAARYFGNGARPGVVLETEQSLAPETVERLRESWERIHRGPQNAHRTAILDSGVKAHEFDGASMQDAQFMQSLEFETSRVCALFRVPPHKIQLLNRATFSNVEQQEIDFRNSCIAPRCVRLEQAFARSLIADSSTYFVRFDLNDLERGDSATRISYLTSAVDRGLLSVNEARAREGLNPVEGGDLHFFPLNMTTLQVMNQPVAAEPSNVQPVLDRLANGGISPEAAKVLLAVQNTMLTPEQIDTIVDGSYVAAGPDRAQVTALLQVIEDVATGVLTPDGATAVITAAFPQLDASQVQAIVGGVKATQQPPPGLPAPGATLEPQPAAGGPSDIPADPTADPLAVATSGANMAATALNGAQIASLLNVLTQTSQGAISPDAAVLVITSAFPTISADVARQMVSSTPPKPAASNTDTKAEQPAVAATKDGGADPDKGDADFLNARAFCATGKDGGIDNSCSSNEGGGGGADASSGTGGGGKAGDGGSKGGGLKGKPPEAPKGDPAAVDAKDSRGAVTGHTAEQRKAHLKEVQQWAKDEGVYVTYSPDSNGPPTMHAIEEVVEGISRLKEAGVKPPQFVEIVQLKPGRMGECSWSAEDGVKIAAGLSYDQVAAAAPDGWFASSHATQADAAGKVLVHEMGHLEHFNHLRGMTHTVMGASGTPQPISLTDRMTLWSGVVVNQNGTPIRGGLRSNGDWVPQWDPGTRVSNSLLDADGFPADHHDAVNLAGTVSQYAATHPLEFVAEVSAGARTGVRYNQNVKRLYEDYGGQPLPESSWTSDSPPLPPRSVGGGPTPKQNMERYGTTWRPSNWPTLDAKAKAKPEGGKTKADVKDVPAKKKATVKPKKATVKKTTTAKKKPATKKKPKG